MSLRQTIQSLIALKQKELPFKVLPRELVLPLDSGKIITIPGVRRCGKSSLMMLAINELINSGVRKEQILWIGFDDERLYDMQTTDLDEIIQAYMEMYPDIPLDRTYMFFDEIQLIKNWELFVLRLFKTYCKNIFVSGSNAQMLSEELATALRGWPLEYEEFPLSFQEFCLFREIDADIYTESGKAKLKAAFREYNSGSAFPEVVLQKEQSIKDRELQSYFNTMLFRDLVEHYELNNPGMIRYFLKRVMSNLTKPTSINSVFNDLKSQGIRVAKDTLYELLEHACSIFLFFKAPKYTASIIQENNSLSKYYIIDNGLRSSVLLPQSGDEGKLLENLVYLHLRRRKKINEKIYYYKGEKECDFVVQTEDEIASLIQVTWLLDAHNTNREIGGILEAAKVTGCRNCLIVTYEQEEVIEAGGISVKVVPAWKWML